MNNVKKFRREFGREITNASSNVSQNAGSRKPGRSKVVLAKGDSSCNRLKHSETTIDESKKADVSTDESAHRNKVVAKNVNAKLSVRQVPSCQNVI
jgi:hypothetical protein